MKRFIALALVVIPALSTSLVAQKITPARPLIVERVDEGALATLHGNTRPEAQAAYDRGTVSPDLAMPGMILILRRTPEKEAAIEAFADSQQDPASPNYHHWLTPEQQGELFGPAQSDIDTITSWLQNHGFRVDSIARNRMSIEFSGTAGLVQSAFHTEIHNLNVKGEGHIANMSDPQIPAALSTAVVGIHALHNFHPHPMHHLGSPVRMNSQTGKWEHMDEPSTPVQAAAKTAAVSSPKTVDSPLFNTGGSTGGLAKIEDIAPYDFATIYNLLPLWNASSPIDGTGQTIAIVGTSDINPADVTAFRKAFGLPAYASATGSTPGLSIIHPNTAPGNCANADPSCISELIENSLDVEWAGAIAKNANIVLVASSSGTSGTFTADPVYVSADYIINHNTAPIMNVSYGECELGLGTAGNAGYNTLWQTASIAGISVFVASGDEGSASCDAGGDASGVPYGARFGLSVSGVASTPYNVAVGGTDFDWTWINNGANQGDYWNTSNTSGTLASAKGYIPESPWNSTCSNTNYDAYVNGVLGTNDSAATLCNKFGTGVLPPGSGGSLASLVDTIGGSGGKSNCTTNNQSTVSSCSGGYPKPSWQAGVTGIPSDNKRDIPDVSFFAANGFSGSAYVICATAANGAVNGFKGTCSYNATTEPAYEEVGGTSVSSPIMAGVMALINQKTGSNQGLPNKILYGLAAKETYSSCSSESVTTSSSCIFNDVDTGTIAMPCRAGKPDCNLANSADTYGILSGYDTTVGYDLATGLGSMNITNAVNAFTTAVAPAVSLSPTSLTFAATVISTSATAQSVKVTNSGSDVLTISKVSLGGTNATSFAQTNDCTSVNAGDFCTITVTFTPQAIGSLSASVSIADNATGSPQTVSLTGTGAEPSGATYSLSATPVTLTAGSTTGNTSTITATGANGYIGPSTVTLSSCTLATSPTAATHTPTCAITTAAVTFAAGATTGSGGLVTISTTAASSSVRKAALGNTAPWAGGAGAVAVAGLLLFIPGRLHKWRSLLGAFLLVATLGVLSGCGGGGGGGGGTTNPGTTKGSYTFTVTGKDSAGTSQSATLNLTVN